MRKSLALILSFCIIFMLTAAWGEEVFISPNTITQFEQTGYIAAPFDPTTAPEAPADGVGTYEVKSTLMGEDSNLNLELVVGYNFKDGQWQEMGNAFVYSLINTDGKTREEFRNDLGALLNDSFETANSNTFYKLAVAYIASNNPSLNNEQAAQVLNQIIVQMDINNFFPDSLMVSYALSGEGTEAFNADVDAKNPVFGGRKYMISPMDNGYILSSRKTTDADTIEGINTAIDDNYAVIINREYGWEQLKAELATLLGISFVPGADPVALIIPVEELADNQVSFTVTGSGALLQQGTDTECWKMETTEVTTMRDTLRKLVENYLTLNTYAKVAGANGFTINVYFDTGKKAYTNESITGLADLLTGIYTEPVLMQDDRAVLPTEGEGIGETEVLDPANTVDPEALPVESPSSETSELVGAETTENPAETLIIAEHTTLAPPEPEATALVETTATPEPTKQPATQVEVIKALVNVRKEPGGAILFKVKRGAIGEITGDTVKHNGWKWYPVLINDEPGFLRGDTVKELEFPITITPTPAPEAEKPEENIGEAIEGTPDNPNEGPATTEVPAETVEPLKRGSKGDAVKALQTRLIELGYLKGDADGAFGRKTEAAVKEAQGIWAMQATGVADDTFLNMLFSENATNLSDAKIMALQPDTMRVATKPVLTGLEYMKKNYEKADKSGYTASVTLNNVGNDYGLTGSIVDEYTTTYESKISFTDGSGAKAINPSFKLTLVNLYIQDVNKVELMRKDELVRELSPSEWKMENGLVVIDLSQNSTLAKEILDTKTVDAIRASNSTTSYKVEIAKNSLPYQITNHMNKIWADMNGEEIAKAAEWVSGQ